MAVVIQQPDALGALNETAKGYTDGRDKALALSMAREKEANDQRNKTRQLDLQQQQTESEVKSRDASTAIAQEQHTYEQSIRPMLEKLSQAQLDGTLKQNDVLEATLQGHKIDNDVKARLAKLGIPEKQAEAILDETRQRVKTSLAQQHQAEQAQKFAASEEPGVLAQQKATLAGTQASTAASLHQANAPYSTGGGSGMNYNNALEGYAALSPAGQKIVDAVESGQITDRQGALQAKKLGAEYPKIVAAMTGLDSDPAKKKANPGADATAKVTSNPAFGKLPGSLQGIIVKELKGGATIQGIASDVKAAKDKDGNPRFGPEITSAVDALAGTAPAAAPVAPAPAPPATNGRYNHAASANGPAAAMAPAPNGSPGRGGPIQGPPAWMAHPFVPGSG